MWLCSINVLYILSCFSHLFPRVLKEETSAKEKKIHQRGIFEKGTPYRFIFEKGKVTNKPCICQAW